MREIKKNDKYICKTNNFSNFIKGNVYDVVDITKCSVGFIDALNQLYYIDFEDLQKDFNDLQTNNIEVKKGDKFLCIIDKDFFIKGSTYDVIGKEGELTVFNVGNNITSYITKLDLKCCFTKVQEVKGCKLVSERRKDFQNTLSKEQVELINSFNVKDAEIVTPKNDPIVSSVMFQLAQRSIVGQSKYGTTLQDNNNDNFLQHLKEELMDAILYIEKLQTLKNK